MKLVRVLAMLLALYVGLGLLADAAIGWFQPQGGNTAVLRTFDAGGGPRDTVLGLLDDNGQLWVESGHWFRGWYRRRGREPGRRARARRSGRALPRDADSTPPEAVDTVTRLMGKGTSSRYWIARTLLLFAPIKPVKLDPRT